MAGSSSTPSTPVTGRQSQSIEPTLVDTSSRTNFMSCALYLEELKGDFDLSVIDDCPACHVLVARHQRRPTLVEVSANTSPQQQLNNSSTSPHSINVAKALRNLKSSHVLPVWKSSTVCHVFISELTYTLENSEVPRQHWFRAFAFVSEDFMVNDWVNRNIIKSKPTFEEACDLFRQHFESAAASDLLAREYLTCAQKPHESVQAYADRFSNICARRGFKNEDDHAIEQFIEHLQPSVQKQYKTQVGLAEANGLSPKVSTLSEVIAYVIALEVAIKGVDVAARSPPTSSSHSKKCIYHPTSTSHTTNDCRLKPNKPHHGTSNHHGTSFSKPKHQTHGHHSSSLNSTANVTCFKCNAKGHFANKCPKSGSSVHGKSFNNRPQQQSSTQSTFTKQQHTSWKSSPPSLTALIQIQPFNAHIQVVQLSRLIDSLRQKIITFVNLQYVLLV